MMYHSSPQLEDLDFKLQSNWSYHLDAWRDNVYNMPKSQDVGELRKIILVPCPMPRWRYIKYELGINHDLYGDLDVLIHDAQ